MNVKPIIYDLGVSIGAISLWLVPIDGVRLIGYLTTSVFAGDAYLRGVTLLSRERRTDEKSAIAYEAETDFYDQLLTQTTEAKLEIAALEVETRMLERLIPLVEQKNRLERQLSAIVPQKSESTGEGLPEDEGSDSGVSYQEKTSCGYLRYHVVEKPEVNEDVDFRKVFPEEMDAVVWKGICKGLGEGLSKADIVRDVLGCSTGQTALGNAYIAYLKNRFWEG